MNGPQTLGRDSSCTKTTPFISCAQQCHSPMHCFLCHSLSSLSCLVCSLKLQAELLLPALTCSKRLLWDSDSLSFLTLIFLLCIQNSLRYTELLRQQLPRAVQSSRSGPGRNRCSEDTRCWTELCQVHLWDAGLVLKDHAYHPKAV